MIYIYGLVDPLVHQIAYVGKTNDLYGRWESHVKTEAEHLAGKWIKRLRAAGIKPTLIVLETLHDDSDWATAERWWIAHGQRMGWPLVNTVHNANGRTDEDNYKSLSTAVDSWEQTQPKLIVHVQHREKPAETPRQKIAYVDGCLHLPGYIDLENLPDEETTRTIQHVYLMRGSKNAVIRQFWPTASRNKCFAFIDAATGERMTV